MAEVSVRAMRVDTVGDVGYIGKEAPVELPAQLDGRPGWRSFPIDCH